MKNVAQNQTPRTDAHAPSETRKLAAAPLATKMRELLGWVAHNAETLAEDDVASYETNCLRSQVLQLLALANAVEALEMHHEREDEDDEEGGTVTAINDAIRHGDSLVGRALMPRAVEDAASRPSFEPDPETLRDILEISRLGGLLRDALLGARSLADERARANDDQLSAAAEE